MDPEDPDSDPDHSQNLITCFLSHLGHFLKISSKYINNFLSYLSLKVRGELPPTQFILGKWTLVTCRHNILKI